MNELEKYKKVKELLESVRDSGVCLINEGLEIGSIAIEKGGRETKYTADFEGLLYNKSWLLTIRILQKRFYNKRKTEAGNALNEIISRMSEIIGQQEQDLRVESDFMDKLFEMKHE